MPTILYHTLPYSTILYKTIQVSRISTKHPEKTYLSLHKALQDVMRRGEVAQIEFMAFSTSRRSSLPGASRGDLDVRMDDSGRIIYVTMPFQTLARIQGKGTMQVNLRVLDDSMPKVRNTCDNPRCTGCGVEKLVPQKRLYAFVWEYDTVFKLTAEECRVAHCSNPLTGEAWEPQPGCHYL